MNIYFNTKRGNKSFETYFEYPPPPIMVQAACLKFRDCCYDVHMKKLMVESENWLRFNCVQSIETLLPWANKVAFSFTIILSFLLRSEVTYVELLLPSCNEAHSLYWKTVLFRGPVRISYFNVILIWLLSFWYLTDTSTSVIAVMIA